MLYQIGFKLTIASRDDAIQLMDLASGCLLNTRPEDRPPNITANQDGTYTVSADIRLVNDAARDELYDSMRQMIPAATSYPGYLTKHDCRHDEGLSCPDPVSICWGEE